MDQSLERQASLETWQKAAAAPPPQNWASRPPELAPISYRHNGELVKRMLKEASEQAALDKDGGKWCHWNKNSRNFSEVKLLKLLHTRRTAASSINRVVFLASPLPLKSLSSGRPPMLLQCNSTSPKTFTYRLTLRTLRGGQSGLGLLSRILESLIKADKFWP